MEVNNNFENELNQFFVKDRKKTNKMGYLRPMNKQNEKSRTRPTIVETTY